jgi:hypothetical protein
MFPAQTGGGVKVFIAFGAMCMLLNGETLNFDMAPFGSVPPGWIIAMTHAGGTPKWEVRADPSGPSPPNVFAQVSTDRTAGRFPLAIWDGANFTDGTVSVKFKTISG